MLGTWLILCLQSICTALLERIVISGVRLQRLIPPPSYYQLVLNMKMFNTQADGSSFGKHYCCVCVICRDIYSMCSQLFSFILWSLPYVSCLSNHECCFNFCVITARHLHEYVNAVEQQIYSTFKAPHLKCLIYFKHNSFVMCIDSVFPWIDKGWFYGFSFSSPLLYSILQNTSRSIW